MHYLITEADDNLATEQDQSLIADWLTTCEWPTLEEVKAELGILVPDDDAYLQRAINATVNSIEAYLGRKVPAQVETHLFRLTDCDAALGYQSKVQLPRWPILEVISCIDPTSGWDINYQVDAFGMLCGRFQDYSQVQVHYHGGTCPIPDDIISVFYSIIGARWSAKDAAGGGAAAGTIKKESIPGVMAIEYFSGTEGSSTGGTNVYDPASYNFMLDPYKTYYV